MSGSTILLVDDDVSLLGALARVLERAEYKVIQHTDGKTALKEIEQDPQACDLVITDVFMPEMKGTELLAHLRERVPEIPVILLTAFGNWGQFMDAMSDGAYAYLDKPISKRELLETVGRALGQRQED